MKNALTVPHLLDCLAALSGCICLSDLRSPRYRFAVHRALERIAPDAYPAAQWRETARYLSCALCPCGTYGNPAQIRRELLAATAA